MAVEMVRTTGVVEHVSSDEWRITPHNDGNWVSVTLDVNTFNVADTAKRNQYITGVGPKAQRVWIKSGIPLARITDTGLFGPYDSDATDGRQLKIEGLLESELAVDINFDGWEIVDSEDAGMRWRGNIVKSKLPVIPPDDAVWGGVFYDIEDNVVTALSPAAGSTTPGGTVIANGSITAEKLANNAVTSDKIADKAVTAEKIADGVIPGEATTGKAGLVKQAAIEDDATVAETVKALKKSGSAK